MGRIPWYIKTCKMLIQWHYFDLKIISSLKNYFSYAMASPFDPYSFINHCICHPFSSTLYVKLVSKIFNLPNSYLA